MGIITQKELIYEKIGVGFGMAIRMMVFLVLAKLKAPNCISETILNVEVVLGLACFIHDIVTTRHWRKYPESNRLRKIVLFRDGLARLEILCCEVCFNLALIYIRGLPFIGIAMFYIVAVSFCSRKAMEIKYADKFD